MPLSFDKSKFLAEYSSQFASSPHFTADSAQNALTMVRFVERDPNITDVRWAAYMLATAMWETRSLRRESHVSGKRNKDGKHSVVISKRWVDTMLPAAEVGQGRGRRYEDPVKVKLLPNGTSRITERDGDQFSISAAGTIRPLNRFAKLGSDPHAGASPIYEEDDGVPQRYYGRGYVQLTWWSNYAKAGISIGRGLDLLSDPELVRNPEIAYKLMAYSMRTGAGFANGHKFSDYFKGHSTDYVNARRMVNGTNHATDIAALAEKLESVLRHSMINLPQQNHAAHQRTLPKQRSLNLPLP